jgi:hypothetical protein
MHGFDPLTQICPTLEFPFATPATDHATVVSDVPVTVAENNVRCPSATVGGATLTVTPLVIVTVDATISGPPAGCGLTAA